MNCSPCEIADWFLCSIDREAGESVTHLKLQKLVYYAQAWSITLFDNPLFDEDFKAWTHGPVLYSLFDKYRDRGWDSLPIPDSCPELTEDTENLLQNVLNVYGKYSAKYLENLTHQECPWAEARGNLPPEARCDSVISKEIMKQYYTELLKNEELGVLINFKI